MKSKALLCFFTLTLCLSLLNHSSAKADSKAYTAEDRGETINLYITFGTLPTLYAGLNAINDSSESYMWFSRKETFKTEYLPKWVTMLSSTEGYGDSMLSKFKQVIQSSYKANKDVKFNLYTDDLRVHLMLELFSNNQIPTGNYSVHLLSDGTATYSYFSKLFNEKDSYSKWTELSDKFSSYLRETQVGKPYINSSTSTSPLYEMMYAAAELKNVEYWLQYPEYLTSNDPNVTLEKTKLNLVKKSPQDIYNSLSNEDKNLFSKAVGINKDQFKNMFNNSAKPELIISGTSLAGEKGNFEQVISNIYKDFGNEYDLYFKPHPAWDPNTKGELKELKRKEFLDSLNIQILPAQLPMESLLWIFPDVKIGGYSSSLYMSANAEQTMFLIADKVEDLPNPLPELYDDGYFGDINFYYLNGYKHFMDIKDHWGKKYIDEAASIGYIKGYGDTLFMPDNLITREEFVVIVDRVFGGELTFPLNTTFTITDEEKIGSWAKDSILHLINNKVISLYEDLSFKPKQYITRSEMVAIVGRILNLPSDTNINTMIYKDKDRIPSWAINYAGNLTDKGIITGREKSLFAPNDNATRAEAITILTRALQYHKESAQ